MTVRLLLIRHGRVDFGARDFLRSPRGRQWDPPLAEEGLEQAVRLTSRLRLMDPPGTILISPFRRCRETIEPYLEATGLPVSQVDDLGEVYIGLWEGVPFEEILSKDEEVARRFRDQEPMFGLAPQGETGAELRARVVPAVESGVDSVREGTVVIVTHAGVINAYLAHVMGIPHDLFFMPENTAISTVRVEGRRREMRFLNDIRHLTDPAIFVPPAGIGSSGRPDPVGRKTPGS